MSVKIEILDYKYGSGDNITDVNAGLFNTGWTAVSSTNAAWDGSGSGVTYLNNISSQNLVIGITYNLSYKITNYSGTGDMGFNTSSGVPISARFAANTNGIQYLTFVATSTSPPDLYGRSTNSGNISNISITDASVIDWDNSIVGELDVTDHSDFPLAMTFQISDFKDLTSTSGDYSKTFKIPATKNNNNIFKHLYIPNISVDNKVTEKKSCRILFNNLYSLVGLIQVDGVGGYGETPSYYNCVFFGSNLNWADKIQDAYMNAIEWGDEGENLTYNKDSIVATWNDLDCNSSNSPIVYPVTSYGQYNELGDARTIQLLDTASTQSIINGSIGYYGFNDDGDSYETPPPASDWRPSVFVKTTLDKIFNAVGYTINSAFMNTDMFKKLVWLLPNFKYNNPEDREIEYGYGNSFTGEGLISSTSIAPTNDQYDPNDYSYIESVIDLNDAGADFVLNSNTDNTGWNATTGVFTAQEYGNYLIKLNNFGLFATTAVYNGGSLNVLYARIRLQVKTVGQTSWNTLASTQTNYFSDAGGSTPIQTEPDASQIFNGGIDSPRYLNKGDQLRLSLIVKAQSLSFSGNQITIHLFGSSTPTSSTTSSSANGNYNIDINPLSVEYGQTYNLQDVMNPDYKQIDFVKGISHAFNLKMTTDESTRTINIEPFDSFYKPYGDAVDWTYKLDRSNETSDKWLESDLKRTLVFKYKSDDADAKVKVRGELYFNDIQDEFPYREILPDTFKKGDSTFENPFFAGTYNAKDNDTTGVADIDTAFSACLWTENVSSNNEGRPPKGYDFLPRLLYWNKYSPDGATVGLNKMAQVQTWSNVNKIIVAKSAIPVVNIILSNIYPQATMINTDNTLYTDASGNTLGTDSPILSYGNVWVRDYDDATGVYTALQAGKGLYDTYYRNMIEGLKRSPRLRTLSIDLTITDIVNLDFTRLVYIDGVYWRINKVVDYKPNNNESTKVELIEWFQIGVFAATAPMFGGGSNDFNPDGSVNTDNNDIGL